MIQPAFTMPLVSMSKVHKTFPERFAARFSEHVQRQRAQANHHRVIADNSNLQGHVRRDQLKKKQSEEMVFSSNEENNIIKRPRTPVVGLDDSEEENSRSNDSAIMDTDSTQSAHRGCTQSCHNTMEPSTLNVKDNGISLSQAWWAVRPKSRGSCARSTSRTTVSLDSVDLWESDSEDCEVNVSTVSKEGYDKVNGVFINPRKTFDFSELRRSRSPMVKEENLVRARNARNEKDTKPVLSKPQENNPPPVTQKSEKSVQKQTVAERLKYLQQRQKELEAEKANKAETGKHTEKKEVNRLHGIDQTDIEMLPQETKQVKSILSPPKEAFVERSKPGRTDRNANNTTGFASKGKPRVRMVPGLHTQPASDSHSLPSARRTMETCVSSDVFPPESVTNMAVEEAASITYPLTAHPRSRRKVKFNSVVSVRDGESNKQDTLRTSSKNSAQTFKQKYLLGIPNREDTVEEANPRPTTPTPPELPCYVELAY